ncbi:MAG: hypothetical protein ACE5JH_07315 [Acidobacteriota bacterium]
MARTHLSDYQRSNRVRELPLHDPRPVREAARRLLRTRDAAGRRLSGAEVLACLARQAGVTTPELVVPDEHQPHRRRGGRIVFSLQGEYHRRKPSPGDPRIARGGKPLGRIRVLNRTPARGDIVRPSAFLHTLLHEFCHHHDAEALGLRRSFHTSGFYARLRHLREQVGGIDAGPDRGAGGRGRGRTGGGAAGGAEEGPGGLTARLWAIIRNL